MNEARYSALTRAFPERAEKLFSAAEKASAERFTHLEKLVALYSVEDESAKS